MTTKTDFHAVKELKEKYTPKERGFVDKAEAALIQSVLEIKTRNDIELQNIRDTVVMLYGRWSENLMSHERSAEAMQDMDAMSAICAIVDQEKFKRGMEV